MRIIGITGPSGAGKSLLSAVLEKHSIPTIDADGVYHSLLVPPSPCLDALRVAFGNGIFLSDGSLDRSVLGAIVFSDEQKLALLNSTVLSLVLERTRQILRQLEADGHSTVAVDAPTLFESGFDSECDLVVSVLSPLEDRLARITSRDGITREAAMLRLKAQKDDEFYISRSDAVLFNDSSPEALADKLCALLRERGFISGANE